MSLGNIEGRILLERYQLVELIGSGAMGQVYRAEDRLLGSVTVAVKFLSQTLLNEKMRHRFESEAKISALLGEKSIHIIRVKDYGVDENGVPFYVMEFLEGQNLSEIIKFQPLNVKRFLHITRQICVGMDAAHSGIMLGGELCQVVHRDIKPSNVLIMQDPTLGEFTKILDFGIARLVQANATQTHSFMGTLAYCSPEQMEGKELDNRSDIYSLGVMMYEMLTLEMPILPETSSFGAWYKAHHNLKPRPFEPDLKIPSELKEVIMKCMAKSPQDRPQTVAEILRIIESLERHNLEEAKTPNFNKDNRDNRGNKDNRENRENRENIVKKNEERKNEPKTDIIKTPIKDDKNKDLKLAWPKNKPLQKIVFPRILETEAESFPSLWVMLDKNDIRNRKSSIRYNQFLFLSSPHPMILWITVIYNSNYGPRWLPCYLDLKTETAEQVAISLTEFGRYKILFFALEEPDKCQHTMISTIANSQCQIMREWIANSRNLPDQGTSKVSKNRLKEEFEKLKPRILMKLQDSYQ